MEEMVQNILSLALHFSRSLALSLALSLASVKDSTLCCVQAALWLSQSDVHLGLIFWGNRAGLILYVLTLISVGDHIAPYCPNRVDILLTVYLIRG